MDICEIKHEFSLDGLCPVCLSVGRNMSSLGQYENAYQNLIPDILCQSTQSMSEVKLCWECLAVLRKASRFQALARKANELLRMGQAHILYSSLSNLTSIVIKDTHPQRVYVNEPNAHTDMKVVCDDDSRDNELVDDGDDDIEDVLKNDDGDNALKTEEVVPQAVKKSKISRWAVERASLNKKKKFKIILTNKLADCFERVQVADEERGQLAGERDGEYSKSKRCKCEKCMRRFVSKKMLQEHDIICRSRDPARYVCDICNSILKDKSELTTHMTRHYVMYRCKLCDFTCHDKSQRQSHCRKKHRRIFQCLKCCLTYGTRREFFQHHKEQHERFICDHCGISFKMRYCIVDHIRKKHSPYECKVCDKRFARYNGLWLHNKTRHGVPTRGAYCVECDRKYADIFRYRWHLANSVRHRPRKKVRIPCPGCDKTFTKKIYMKDHYDLVHLKKFKYRCEECDKNFVRNAELVQHKRRIHQGLLPPRNKICYVCGRGFTTNKILHNHVRTHTGERPFACARCDARFAQAAARNAHERALHSDQANLSSDVTI